jgi:hypothetical protein
MAADAEWDEAFSRVESYLHAQEMESRMLVSQIAAEIIVDARTRAAEDSEAEPVTLALQGALVRFGACAAEVVSAQLPSGPEVNRSGMSAAPLEFGFLDSDTLRVPAREIWLQARGIVSWLIIFGFFGIVWESSH